MGVEVCCYGNQFSHEMYEGREDPILREQGGARSSAHAQSVTDVVTLPYLTFDTMLTRSCIADSACLWNVYH